MKRLITLSFVISCLIGAIAAGPSAQVLAAPPAPVPPAPAQAQQAQPQNAAPQPRGVIPRFATRQILDDLYQIAFGGDMVCMYVLVGRDKALVVDTSMMQEYDGVKIIDRVKAVTDKPLIVVNTHPHGDHTAANVQFGEAYASAVGVEEIKAAAALDRRSRPSATPAELYIAITTAQWMGIDAITLAERKAALNVAPVYMYVFAFQRATMFLDAEARSAKAGRFLLHDSVRQPVQRNPQRRGHVEGIGTGRHRDAHLHVRSCRLHLWLDGFQ
jgi:hypothetical protein